MRDERTMHPKSLTTSIVVVLMFAVTNGFYRNARPFLRQVYFDSTPVMRVVLTPMMFTSEFFE